MADTSAIEIAIIIIIIKLMYVCASASIGCVRVCACVRACVRARVRACARMCEPARVYLLVFVCVSNKLDLEGV